MGISFVLAGAGLGLSFSTLITNSNMTVTTIKAFYAISPIGLDMFPIDINLKYIPSSADILAVKALCTAKQNILIDFVDQTGCRIMEAIRLKTDDIHDDKITLWTRKAKNSNLTPRTVPRPECFNGLGLERTKEFLRIGKLQSRAS